MNASSGTASTLDPVFLVDTTTALSSLKENLYLKRLGALSTVDPALLNFLSSQVEVFSSNHAALNYSLHMMEDWWMRPIKIN